MRHRNCKADPSNPTFTTRPFRSRNLQLPFVLLVPLLSAAGCSVEPGGDGTSNAPAPTVSYRAPLREFVGQEPTPAAPTDPLDRVVWTMNYDIGQFDATWNYLLNQAPQGRERIRALALASLLGFEELGRNDLLDPGVAYFEEAVRLFPEDYRLPLWGATLAYRRAQVAGDLPERLRILEEIRPLLTSHATFTVKAFMIIILGDPEATPEQIQEVADRLPSSFVECNDEQFVALTGKELEDYRQVCSSTPLAPYNIAATTAIVGDLNARLGRLEDAQFSYINTILEATAYRWPWLNEVERRVGTVLTGTYPDANTMISAGFRLSGYGTKLGTGACTLCHSHVNNFALDGAVQRDLGWIKGRFKIDEQAAPNAAPLFLAYPKSQDPVPPAGYFLGEWISNESGLDFRRRDELYDNSFYVAVPPGEYWIESEVYPPTYDQSVRYRGYSGNSATQPKSYVVKKGQVTDITREPIELRPTTGSPLIAGSSPLSGDLPLNELLRIRSVGQRRALPQQ